MIRHVILWKLKEGYSEEEKSHYVYTDTFENAVEIAKRFNEQNGIN